MVDIMVIKAVTGFSARMYATSPITAAVIKKELLLYECLNLPKFFHPILPLVYFGNEEEPTYRTQ